MRRSSDMYKKLKLVHFNEEKEEVQVEEDRLLFLGGEEYSTTNIPIYLRSKGEFRALGFFLPSIIGTDLVEWVIGMDSTSSLCLIPLKKGA